MRRMWMTAFLTAAAFAAHTTTAHADASLREYKEAMRPFAPVIAAWTAEAQSFGDAALTKPELVCKPEIAEMARRGGSIADDVAGTAAPDALAMAHVDLANAFVEMSYALDHACGAADPLARTLAPSVVKAQRALGAIRRFVDEGIAPIELPSPGPAHESN